MFAFALLGVFSNFGVCAHALCAILARGSPISPCALGPQSVLVAATPACRLFEDHKPVPPSLPAETATVGAASDRGVASPRSPVSCVTSPCNTLGLKWTSGSREGHLHGPCEVEASDAPSNTPQTSAKERATSIPTWQYGVALGVVVEEHSVSNGNVWKLEKRLVVVRR